MQFAQKKAKHNFSILSFADIVLSFTKLLLLKITTQQTSLSAHLTPAIYEIN